MVLIGTDGKIQHSSSDMQGESTLRAWLE
jgi:hypothetical protein